MGRDKAEETVEAGHGSEGGGGLFGGESTGRSEDASVNTATIVEQVAYCYLQLLELGGGGWGRKVRPSGGLGGPGSKGGGGVEGRGRGRTDPVGAKAGEKGGDIARVRERESFEGAVVVKGKAEKFG
jgi:hypothetical protein